MKDAFRTISFRSEPTIGEEDLKRCYDTQMPGNGVANFGTGYPVVEKKRQEMIQNLVPHCFEHIQNFHHYRSDMENLSSGCKVLYLSADDESGKKERVLRRVMVKVLPKPNSSVHKLGRTVWESPDIFKCHATPRQQW